MARRDVRNVSTNDWQVKSNNALALCPFCGGEANTLHRPHVIDWRYSVGCNDDECRGFIGLSWLYKTEAEAIAAWNSRADYHGFEQAAIEAWDSVKAWNTRAERTCEFNIKDNMNETEGMGDVWIECSACHCVFDFYADEWLMKMSYCPSCGARRVGI